MELEAADMEDAPDVEEAPVEEEEAEFDLDEAVDDDDGYDSADALEFEMATRITAARRGQKARRDVAAKRKVGTNSRAQEMASAYAAGPAPGKREAAAATRVQAARRGQQGRRTAQAQRAATHADDEYYANHPLAALAAEEAEEEQDAAARVQAARRGQLTRRETNARKADANSRRLENSAASRVQAARRGQQGRRQVSNLQQQRAAQQKQQQQQRSPQRAPYPDAALVEELAEWKMVAEHERNAAADAAARAIEAEALAASEKKRAVRAEKENNVLKNMVSELQQKLEEAEKLAALAAAASQEEARAAQREKTGRGGVTLAEAKLLERAENAEFHILGLNEKLSASEASVKMLRQQIRKYQDADGGSTGRGTYRAPSNLQQQKPGRNYAPRRLPKLNGQGNPDGDAALKAREAGFVVDAFPDYGGKTKSGLKSMGKQRLEEAHEEHLQRLQAQQQARRKKQMQAERARQEREQEAMMLGDGSMGSPSSGRGAESPGRRAFR